MEQRGHLPPVPPESMCRRFRLVEHGRNQQARPLSWLNVGAVVAVVVLDAEGLQVVPDLAAVVAVVAVKRHACLRHPMLDRQKQLLSALVEVGARREQRTIKTEQTALMEAILLLVRW
jgi:hypothetical protein